MEDLNECFHMVYLDQSETHVAARFFSVPDRNALVPDRTVFVRFLKTVSALKFTFLSGTLTNPIQGR